MQLPATHSDRKERMMSQLVSRTTRELLVLALSASCFACGSDQKQPSSPDDGSSNQIAPVTTGTPPSPEVAPPNGPPTDIPPTNPPPQSLNEPQRGNSVAMPSSTGSGTSGTPLSQAQIAKVTELANAAEIEHAKVAQTRAKSPSVKKFAALMIQHHTEARTSQAKLYKQLSVTPATSETATLLQSDADRALGNLRAADGAAFDLTYMESQVDAHQKVLDTIDQQLLPAATEQAVIAELNKMRATVESHLTEAKRIRDELSKSR